jgi:AraC-like DNA-binding protein
MSLPADGDYNKVPYENNVQVMFYENKENENYPLHWHTATEIIMPLECGYDVLLLNKQYKLRENDILIIPSCELHSITVPPSAEKGKRIILMFEPTLLYSLSGLSGTMLLLYNINLLIPEDTPEIYGTVRSFLLAIHEEFLKADALRNPAIYAKIIELYIAMARYYARKNLNFQDVKPSRQQEYVARLNAVFEYIDQHATEELTLDGVAKVANFSPYHFERIFKKYTNTSFYQYLKHMRIKKAESLLLTPELPITKVALDSGFGSITAFNRTFREIKHCTPSEYKKLYRQKA